MINVTEKISQFNFIHKKPRVSFARYLIVLVLMLFSLSGCGNYVTNSSTSNGHIDSNTLSEPNSSATSSLSENTSDISSSADLKVNISATKPLTCGEFVWLWMAKLDGSPSYNKTITQAVEIANQQGYIPSKMNINAALTVQEAAYLLTSTKLNSTKIDSTHYDWQISDLNNVDSSYKVNLLTAYAEGLLTTDNGNIDPKNSVYLKDATAIITRVTDMSQRLITPNYSAPYFEYQGLVEVARLDPTIVIDLKYATTDNYTGVVHYSRALCLLEADTAKKLIAANKYFEKQGYSIKIWDGYRPESVQWSLYYAAPKNLKQYVPAPSKNSQHSKGIAADITLVDKNGKEMAMLTGFDSFSDAAHADYNNLPKQIIENRNFLIAGMEQQGFVVNSLEWWHYYMPDKTNLQISKVSLDEFAEKQNEFYQTNIQKYYSDSK
jgi:D-alanyl-D-alanine dipeptidase